MVNQVTQFLLEIRRRTKNDTKVVYLQYPYLVLDNPEWAFTSSNGSSLNVDFEIRITGDLGDSFQRQAVQDANVASGMDFVVYVDTIKALFDHHEVDPRMPDATNPQAWIQELDPLLLPGIFEQFHFNNLGHEAIANHLINEYGTFGMVENLTSNTSGINKNEIVEMLRAFFQWLFGLSS